MLDPLACHALTRQRLRSYFSGWGDFLIPSAIFVRSCLEYQIWIRVDNPAGVRDLPAKWFLAHERDVTSQCQLLISWVC